MDRVFQVYFMGMAAVTFVLVAFLWVLVWEWIQIGLPLPMLIVGGIGAAALTIFNFAFWIAAYRERASL